MKKIALFPFDYYLLPVVNNAKNLVNFELVKVLSLEGWGMVNKSVSVVCKDDTANELVIADIFDENLEFDFDIVYITNSNHIISDDVLYQSIEHISLYNKDIIIAKKITLEQEEQIRNICTKNKVKVKFLCNDSDKSIIEDDIDVLYPIDIPLITVSGLDENTNKFEVQLSIYNNLVKDGYKVSWVSSRNEILLCGEHPMPNFMFDNKISETRKILMYNHFIKYIQDEENPDVIIIGVSGEIMPNSKLQIGHFGSTAFHIFNAINADFNVFCTHCSGNNKEYFDELLLLMKYRFSVDIDSIVISTLAKDPFSLNKISAVEYILYNNDFTKNVIQDMKYTKCPLFDRNTYTQLYSFLIDTLNGYDELQVF